MKSSMALVAAFALALLVLALSGCASDPEIIFVREDLDIDGEPRQILKIVEGATVAAAYYDGAEWVVVEGVEIPQGWLVVSPALAEPEVEK